MRPQTYKIQWNNIKTLENLPAIEHLTRQIAFSFIDKYLHNGFYEEKYIHLLCEIATSNIHDQINDFASKAIFGIIIESLCDDFEDMQTETYNMVMAQIISFIRKTEKGSTIDRMLCEFNINSSWDILDRIETIRLKNKKTRLHPPAKKILILSRITIGADIAITSVIVQRMQKLFPEAKIIIAGTPKLKNIFGGNPDIKIRGISYSRRGEIFDRFLSWIELLKIVEDEKSSISNDEFMVIDPDSRLTQLGILPLVSSKNYFLFSSRDYIPIKGNISMPVIVNRWIDQVFGVTDFSHPKVWLNNFDKNLAKNFISNLKEKKIKIITLNFGVGGNHRKKISIPFEEKLLLKLLEQPDTVIILDKGFGDEEVQSSNYLINQVLKNGFPAINTSLTETVDEKITSGIIGIQCGIGEMGAIIAESHEFIGYDSACQHLSSALGIPTLTIFAGSNNPRFVRRWSAFGPGKCEMVHVDTLTDPENLDVGDIVARILDNKNF